MIILMLVDFRFIFLGLLVAPVYAFCWTLYEKELWLKPQKEWINIPTKWAEIIVGGMVYAGAYWVGYLRGSDNAKIEYVTKEVEVVRYVTKEKSKIQSKPNATRDELLKRMYNGKL